jgi:hypothetical protein
VTDEHSGEIAVMVQQAMELDRILGPPERHPVPRFAGARDDHAAAATMIGCSTGAIH